MWTKAKSSFDARASEAVGLVPALAGIQGRFAAPPTRRRRSAFTLTEILMVVVILGIAAGVVIPMIGQTDDINLSAASRKLISDLLMAQNYAITHQTNVQVSFQPPGQYTLTEIPAVGAPTVLTDPLTNKAYIVRFGNTALAKVTLANTDAAVTFTFTSLGSPQQGGAVTLNSGARSIVVQVAAITGKVTVQ